MEKEPLGITFIVPDNQDAIGVYEAEGGVEVFETDEPYLLSDGKSLVDPMPVRMVDGPIYQDTLGNAQSALAITLASSWSPADLFANGEQGSLWGPLPYYSDAAGTVESGWGDPVGNIPDASGNGTAWAQVTSTARPILGRVPVTGRKNKWENTTVFDTWTRHNQIEVEEGEDGEYLLIPTQPSGNHQVSCVVVSAFLEGETYTYSVEARPAGINTLSFVSADANEINPIGTFDLSTGTAPSGGTIEELDDGWYKLTRTATSNVNRSPSQYIRVGVSTPGDGESGMWVRNPQIEPGSSATTAQIIINQYDITEAGVRGIHYLRFDGTDDSEPTTLPAISGGTIVLAGTNGIWIDSLDFAGGVFSVGPDTYTGGPAGLMSILGDILERGCFVIDRALTPEEIAKVEGYYKARGAAGLFVLGNELVVNGDFSDGATGWTLHSSASVIDGGLAFDGSTIIATGTILAEASGSPLNDTGVHLVSFQIVEDTLSPVALRFGGDVGPPLSAPGVYQRIVNASPEKVSVRARVSEGVRSGSIDNISVRKLELIP